MQLGKLKHFFKWNISENHLNFHSNNSVCGRKSYHHVGQRLVVVCGAVRI